MFKDLALCVLSYAIICSIYHLGAARFTQIKDANNNFLKFNMGTFRVYLLEIFVQTI